LTTACFAAGSAAALWAAARRRGSSRRSRTVMQVRPRPLPLIRDKVVTATKRLPLWRLSDEMYLERQLSPNPDLNWTQVRRDQARMREMVLAQQKKDMWSIGKEIAGERLPPTHPLGSLRKGMWLEGRVSSIRRMGVSVDVGAYTEKGEWVDGYCHLGQIREDGEYVRVEDIAQEVYLGERVRVRVRECVPAAGTLDLSMRTADDLPELFLGKPRPYNWWDLQAGMKVTGIVRRVWDKWAIVDIGADRMARLHVREHKRELTRYGFLALGRLHKYANTCYFVGAQMDLWIKSTDYNRLTLTCNKPRSIAREPAQVGRKQDNTWLEGGIAKTERLTHEQRREREKAAAEKASWDPYVPHVDEWLEDAMEPDEETDSWVAKTERELFDELDDDEEDEEDEDLDAEVERVAQDFQKAKRVYDRVREQSRPMAPVQEEEDEDFADDDFADDDFLGDEARGSEIGFGPHAFPANELDGWVLDDVSAGSQANGAGGGSDDEPTDTDIDAFLLEGDDDDDMDVDDFAAPRPRGSWSGASPPPR